MTPLFWLAVALGVAALAAVAWVVLRLVLRRMVEDRLAHFQSRQADRHLEEIQAMYDQMRGWRHDYHNHIQTMKAHLALGRTDQLDAYLDQLDADLDRVDMVVKTGNLAADAILNGKLSLARQQDIALHAKAYLPPQLPIGQLELSVILGNLLDNAIEACARVQPPSDRFLRLYLDVIKGRQLYLSISNACAGTRRENGRFLTSKREAGHGLGLARVDAVVKRCGGWVNRQYEPGVFATEVFLPLPEGVDGVDVPASG